jgi:hypothetical protein
MWSLALVGGSVVLIALLAVYVPTIYIRKTNRLLETLERIAANTQASPRKYAAADMPGQARTA